MNFLASLSGYSCSALQRIFPYPPQLFKEASIRKDLPFEGCTTLVAPFVDVGSWSKGRAITGLFSPRDLILYGFETNLLDRRCALLTTLESILSATALLLHF